MYKYEMARKMRGTNKKTRREANEGSEGARTMEEY